jgi:hypothetical protein
VRPIQTASCIAAVALGCEALAAFHIVLSTGRGVVRAAPGCGRWGRTSYCVVVG